MSKKSNQIPDVPAAGKLTSNEANEKSALYSNSSTTDSGFISSGNLIFSGDLSEEILEPEHTPDEPPAPAQEEVKEDNLMRLDSGMCLSESLSNLSLNSPGLNDLSGISSSAKSQKIEPTTQLIRNSSDDVPWRIYFEQDEDGDTHLHSAIMELYTEVALALIRAAPHRRLLDTPNDMAQTPLHLAVATGQWVIVRWLIVAGARPNPRDLYGDSPMHIASRAGDSNCVKAITDPVQQQEWEKLQLSCTQESYQPCNLDQWNYIGQTPVHVAAQNSHIDVLRHLVWNGADINAREGCMGYTALHYALEKRDEPLIQFLMSECSRLNPELLTYGRRSVLEVAAIDLPSSITSALKARGVPSPYMSEDEDYDEDSSDENSENSYENAKMFVPNLVNATA